MAAVRVGRFWWVPVVGLEIHARIATASKLFSPAQNSGAVSGANSRFDLLDAAIPGVLPVLNRRAVSMAIETSLALKAHVNEVSYFDRKHYFYADLPAGYQITQQRVPLAVDGSVKYPVFHQARSRDHISRPPCECLARVSRVQLEHDSAKTIADGKNLLVDLNRCGMPLMEIVTQPDFQCGLQALALVREIVRILRTVGSSEAKFDNGSIRVDATVSVHKPDDVPAISSLNFLSFSMNDVETGTLQEAESPENQLSGGTLVEIKNISSPRFLSSVIDHEIRRQISVYESGESILNETRGYDESALHKSVSMRDKTRLHDYRFLPEMNLPPLVVDKSSSSPPFHYLELSRTISQLQFPRDIRTLLQEKYNLHWYCIGKLFDHDLVDLFLDCARMDGCSENANILVLNVILPAVSQVEIKESHLRRIIPKLVHLSKLKAVNRINIFHIQNILSELAKDSDLVVEELIETNGWKIEYTGAKLDQLIDKFAAKKPKLWNQFMKDEQMLPKLSKKVRMFGKNNVDSDELDQTLLDRRNKL